MSILSYEDICHFHGHHQRHDNRCFDPSYVKETSKKIDICDKFGNLRYVVELKSDVFSPGERGYKVIVSQMLPYELKTFLEIPDGDLYEFDYIAAMSSFNACVKKYKSLIDAEMRDFRDIDVYSEDINYKVQEVECCQNCKWCLKTAVRPKDCHSTHRFIKFQCCCPMNEQVFNYAQDFPQIPHHRHMSAWQKLPWQKPEDIHMLDCHDWDPRKFPSIMFPTVDQLGKCQNYASGEGYLQYGHHAPPQYYQIASTIAPPFVPTAAYKPGDLVYYGGKLYQCIVQHDAGNWNDNDFMPMTVDGALKQKPDASVLSNYVENTVLSGLQFSENPPQREIADRTRTILSVLGGEVQ